MRLVLIAALAASLASAAAAQDAPVPVPLNAQERGAIMEACVAAQWASRRQFEGLCDYLRGKFEGAEKAATDKAKPADPQPKE